MAFRVIRNDITKVKADVLVNAANPNPVVGRGVDSAIYEAAGFDELLNERKKIGVLDPGSVAITSAFALDAKYIIHVSGPVWNGGDDGEIDTLRRCYDEALKLAVSNGCKSIAFPLLATGFYGFPQEVGMRIAVDAFTKFLEDNEIEIILVVFGNESVRVSNEVVGDVESFIDEAYVGSSYDEPINMRPSEEKDDESDRDEIRKNYAYSGSMLSRRSKLSRKSKSDKKSKREIFSSSELSSLSSAEMKDEEDSIESCMIGATPTSLEDELKKIYTDSFAKHLQQIINKKGLKNSQVYSTANITKQYFSKLLKGQVNPSKEKVLALAVGLRLNLDETVDFLRLAGYALSPISQTDTIVAHFIRNKKYNVIEINLFLFDMGLDGLTKEVD